MNIETESKISLLLTFIQWFVTESKLSLVFTKTLLFPHETAYFSNSSHNAYKKADGKQPVIAKDEIKVSVILANKYEVKAKNFIIPVSVYGN